MTVPRKEILSPDIPTYFHCYSRCVRRAFLWGLDPYTGKSFEHRREWIRSRTDELLSVFAIDQAAYGIMMGHSHKELRTRPDLAANWSADEIARRWRRLFPRRRNEDGSAAEPSEVEIQAIISDAELVEEYRSRLSSISWFHRCLNEYIARKANKEDGCKGRFWEGRFRSERLETEAAVIACAVYIDLNPIRAGIAKTPEESQFTSIEARIAHRETKGSEALKSLVSVSEFTGGKLTEEQYPAP